MLNKLCTGKRRNPLKRQACNAWIPQMGKRKNYFANKQNVIFRLTTKIYINLQLQNVPFPLEGHSQNNVTYHF